MTTKRCFKCNSIKDINDFYTHKSMPDGHVNKCKECTKEGVRKNRELKIDYYREYDRKRGNRQDPEYLKNYRKQNPKKYKATKMVSYAVRSGKMRMMPCEVCQDKETHGHHDDYSYPLTVRWLCPACHKKWHDENGEGLNG